MANPILDIFKKLCGLPTSGGYERYQITVDELNKARGYLQSLGHECIPCLKRCLRDTDIQIQLWAVAICDASPPLYKAEIIQLLLFQLKLEKKRKARQNSHLIAEITKMLTTLGDTTLVDEIVSLLESDDVEDRKKAVMEFGKKAYNHIDRLVDIIKTDPDSSVRVAALNRLDLIRNEPGVYELYTVTITDDDPRIRAITIDSLAKRQVQTEQIKKMMVRSLDDDTNRVLSAVIRNLHRYSIPETVPKLMYLLTTVLSGFIPTILQGLNLQIVKFNNLPTHWQPLFDVIDNADKSYQADKIYHLAIDTLQAMDDLSAMPYFITYMMRPKMDKYDPERHALDTLKIMRDKIDWQQFKDTLTPYLQSEDANERRAGIQILGEVGADDSKSLLEKLRVTETNPDLITLINAYL